MKYKYIVIDCADRYYEGESSGMQFSTYEETLAFLKAHKCNTLIEHLDYLESIKDTLQEYNGCIEVVVSYA